MKALWLAGLLSCALAATSFGQGSCQQTLLFDNSNIGGVTQSPSGPPSPTIFTLAQPKRLTNIWVYHWNGTAGSTGGGAAPTIELLDLGTGAQLGPWAAVTYAGSGGAPDVNWAASPDVVVAPGMYQVLSSDAATWSYNAQSMDSGFAMVSGCDAPTPLSSSVSEIQVATGGVQPFALDAGAAFGGLTYLLLGSASGSSPGFPIDGLLLPLNADAYTITTLIAPNSAPLSASLGTLDASGKATAQFTLPGGLPPAFVGLELDHAFVVVELLPTLLHLSLIHI